MDENRLFRVCGPALGIKRAGLSLVALLAGCSINFEVTSQRTALENQVMGTYKEIDDDLVLISSVRTGSPKASSSLSVGREKAALARQNQDFNRDDLDELKAKGLLGEANDGRVALLPVNLRGAADEKSMRLAAILVDEENADRGTIWQRVIDSNENLSARDLGGVRQTYARQMREVATVGDWFQDEAGRWQQKKVQP